MNVYTLLDWVSAIVDGTGVVVMVIGFSIATLGFFKLLFIGDPESSRMMSIQRVRCELGMYLALGLELMIVSDLLLTVVSHTLDDLIFLGTLVSIRTIIGFFLSKEIQELR